MCSLIKKPSPLRENKNTMLNEKSKKKTEEIKNIDVRKSTRLADNTKRAERIQKLLSTQDDAHDMSHQTNFY